MAFSKGGDLDFAAKTSFPNIFLKPATATTVSIRMKLDNYDGSISQRRILLPGQQTLAHRQHVNGVED